MGRATNRVSEKVEEFIETAREGGLSTVEEFSELIRSYALDGGMAASAARSYALSRLQTAGTTNLTVANEYGGITKGAFESTKHDALVSVREARRLNALTLDDLPYHLLHDFEIATGEAPFTDREFERVFVGRYTSVGTAHPSEPAFRYVVFRQQFVVSSEQTAPDDSPRYLFAGTEVGRYGDEEELAEEEIHNRNFASKSIEYEFIKQFKRAGLSVESSLSRELSEGDTVSFEWDGTEDEIMKACDGEEATVVEKMRPGVFRIEIPSVTDPDSEEAVTIETTDSTLSKR